MKKYVSRRDIARAVGLTTGAIAKMDREGRGPGWRVFISLRHVVYLESEVTEFFRARGIWEPVWRVPQERGARRRAATLRRDEHEARPQTPPTVRSGLLAPPSDTTPHDGRRVVTAETEEP